MIEGRPFLYQAPIDGTVYHVAEKGVEVVQSWSSKETIVAFVDCDEGNSEPNRFLMQYSVQLVVALYPDRANFKWTDQTGDGSFVSILAIKLWSFGELFRTGLVLAIVSTLD